MKKRILAVLLCLCMVLTMLPVSALAAVGGLLNNTPEQNETLLEKLQSFTGESPEEALELLDSMGLLDEDGNLITDQTIDLDGKQYTLEEMEALLEDPSADLSQVAYADGVPIALGDLKTVIAIERELQHLQETYFSGKTFDGEARENLNSLVTQLQTAGIAFQSAAVGDTHANVPSVNVNNFTAADVDSGEQTLSIPGRVNQEYSVTVTLDPGLLNDVSVTVSLGRDTGFTEKDSVTLNSGNPTGTLNYTARAYDASYGVPLTVNVSSSTPDVPDYAYGELAGAVHFSNAQGFVFESDGQQSDSHTLRLTKTVDVPDLSTKWMQTDWTAPESTLDWDKYKSPDVYFEFMTYVTSSSNEALGITKTENLTAKRETINEFIRFLQGAKGYTSVDDVKDDVVQFSLTVGSLSAHCSYQVRANAWNYEDSLGQGEKPNMYFLPEEEDAGVDRVDLKTTNYGLTLSGYPSSFARFSSVADGGRETTLQFDASTQLGTNAVPERLEVRDCVYIPGIEFGGAAYNYGMLKDTAVELINDGKAPTLKSATTPSGTYRPGQLVPVVLAFDELVYVSDSASIEIGGKPFTPNDLHMSKAGNQLMFWYPVQKVDGKQVTITSLTGITDIFGNEAEIIGKTAEGAEMESARMRDAATGLSAAYENGQATVTVTLSEEEAYQNKYASYHTPASDEAQEVPFQAVVTDENGEVIAVQQVYVNEDGETFATQPFAVAAQNDEMTYTVTLQANEGKREDPNWVDLSYNTALQDSFSVSALVQAATVTVTDDSEGDYELSLADTVRPTLTAKVYGPDGSTLASSQSGTWSSSDTAIATITTENDYSGKVTLTGQKVGEVTFTFTADNGTPDDDSDDKTGKSQTYTVVAGESIALVIPEGASTIVVRQNAAATVLWSSNASQFAPGADFQYTIEVFQGNHTDEATLTGEPVYKTTAAKDKNSVLIPENVLSELSTRETPAYTVRVSMPHPNGSGEDVRLSALAWIVVHPEPATAVLTRPESLYLKDDEGPVEIGWSLENYTRQTATLTILRVTEDSTSEKVCNETLSSGSGTYTLNLSQVAEGNLKDTYQVMLSVDNGQYESPSTDSFPLYVYNADALQIVNSEDKPITELTLDNTNKVSGNLPTDTREILSMRQELGLLDYIGINYGDYDWNSFKDGIAWATTNEKISVNYKQGGLYEDIQLFDFDTYLPELKMGIATVEGGEATITATHAATGMKDTISVTADTLQDQFYLFQVTPAVTTTLRYTNGDDEERTVTTNSEGVLALYEPSGIASDVWLNSEVTEDDETTEYLGTIYNYDLQSGEGDARKLQLYPLNTFRLREAAKAELTLVTPDGSPLAGSEVIVRGGVYKNGYFCETAGLGIDRKHIGHAGEAQQDTPFTTDENGKLTVYFDFTQFWSEEAGETANSLPTAEDKIQYVLEVRDIADDAYYPLFQMVDGTVSPMQEMRTASGVVVLEDVPQGEANKPFVARQVIDYHLEDGALIDTRYSTGFVGPNYNFKEAVLTTDMLLWGESGDGASYSLTMVDENGYSPEAQVPTGAERYPFTSMPVVENTLTLTKETMTTSGWIPDGEDVGLKTRLTQDGALVQERTMPFRAIDLTDVKPVQEDKNVTGMVATLVDSSGWDDQNINFGNGGSSILNTLIGDLGELAGPVNTSVFQMLITPSEDPSVFNALIWAGYDSLDLKDVEYKNGVAVSANFMTKGLETDMPSVGDLQQMANGTYDPMAAYDPYQSNRLSDVAGFDFGVQLEGYYEAEIRYNRTSGDWEVYTKGGGFTAGVGMEFGFNVNTVVGIVPVTGSFEVGGAMQLSLQAATRYSEQEGLEWSDSEATAVTDFLTELRLRAYVEAFGGFGFDFSLIALKIGLFGKLDVNSQNRFLSREYLAEEAQQQTNGQYLHIQSEVGIKFKAVFALISYEKVLASGSFGAGKDFGQWTNINNYWENTGTGMDSQSRQYAAAASSLREVSSTATLQSRDYLEQYARTWGNTQARMSLFSLDEKNGVKNLQTNANPASFPELSDDGKVLAYISDGNSDSIYDSRAHYSLLNDDGSYGTSQEFPDGGFEGYGDSDVDIAGVLKTDYTGGNATAAAAWVRQSAQIPGKDAGAEITAEEQNLLMNSSEIMVSVWSKGYGDYGTSGWTTTRLTENATPDLAPAVAVNGTGKAIVFWRSVYSAAPESGLMDFSSQDQIMYSYYDGTKWSDAKMLYNGANGSVKGLQAAMLNDGTAMAVYTLDRNTEASDGSGQEIGYTIVKSDGTLGTSMLVTSDKTLDENPQVAAGSLGDTTNTPVCFILGWHSQRDGVSDIQLLAVDENGVMSNTFPASLSALTSSGQANVSGDFRFALDRKSIVTVSSLKNLTILWSETVSDETTNRLMTAAHSQLKAARLLAEDTDDDDIVDDFWLTAPQVVAELPENTLLDHFDAYVREGWNAIKTKHPIKAVIQATYYDQTNPHEIYDEESKTTVTLPGEETKLYTATHNFEAYGLEVEAIGVDYANLMAESLTPIQFTVRNTGVNEVTDLTVTLEEEETATLEEALAPNESATLTVYHGIDEAVSNVEYTITGNGVTGNTTTGEIINQSGTVYLDYPDIGISQMKVLEENKGQRTIAVTLYNTSDAPLAGSGRTVKVGFYTDSMLEEKASVTYNGKTTSDAITISDDDLARIDAGSYTLVLTYNIRDYVTNELQEKEIPESGVYLYADAWAEGTIGSQSEVKRLPEYHSGDNQSAVLLTGAYARTGEMTALDVVLDNSDDTTTATVTLKNNSLQDQEDNGTLVALLLDENGNTLDTQTVTEETELTCEQNKQIPVNFQEKGTDVILLYVPAESTETQLRFSNIDVDLSDFEPDPDTPDEYTYTLQGDAPASTTVIFSSSEKVTINGEEQSTRVGSVQVPIPTGSSTITVTIGATTYHLHLTRSGGGGGETTYPPTILETEHGTVTVDPTHPRQGDTVTITAQPDEGYEVGEVTVTRPDGSQVELTENSDGIWGFTQPGESVTIAVTFRCDGGELCPSAHLTDVELNAWYHEAVDYVVEHGIMAGVSATAFQPNGSLTRGQVVQILHNLEGKPEETAEAPFTDTAGHWALEAIAWAAQNNVVAGYDDGTFGPEKLVTREEFAQMMYNYAKFKGYDLTAGGDLAQFPDAGAISDWAETALSWANGKGLINGHDNGTIDPQGNTTRAQAASIMKNFDLKVVED